MILTHKLINSNENSVGGAAQITRFESYVKITC